MQHHLRRREDRIGAGRERALDEKATLNEQLARWLASFAQALKARQVDDRLAALRGRLEHGQRIEALTRHNPFA